MGVCASRSAGESAPASADPDWSEGRVRGGSAALAAFPGLAASVEWAAKDESRGGAPRLPEEVRETLHAPSHASLGALLLGFRRAEPLQQLRPSLPPRPRTHVTRGRPRRGNPKTLGARLSTCPLARAGHGARAAQLAGPQVEPGPRRCARNGGAQPPVHARNGLSPAPR